MDDWLSRSVIFRHRCFHSCWKVYFIHQKLTNICELWVFFLLLKKQTTTTKKKPNITVRHIFPSQSQILFALLSSLPWKNFSSNLVNGQLFRQMEMLYRSTRQTDKLLDVVAHSKITNCFISPFVYQLNKSNQMCSLLTCLPASRLQLHTSHTGMREVLILSFNSRQKRVSENPKISTYSFRDLDE